MTLEWLEPELAKTRQHGLFRSLRSLTSPQGPVIEFEGKQLINFSSNDYLGLAADPRLIRASQAAAARWGTGAGASRLISGNLAVFAKLESALARLVKAEAALLFTSGYHANLGAIASLVGRDDAVFSDRLNHASIIDGCRLCRARIIIYEHGDVKHLDKLLGETSARRKLVVTETVFSMEGDLAPLPDLIAVVKKHGAMLMVDEAHAMGVLGAAGAGALEHFGLEAADVDVLMGTLGKALGSSGAFVAGSKKLIEYLVNFARTFIFTTGPAPAAAGAAMEALRVMEQEPWRQKRVRAHAQRVRAALIAAGINAGAAAAAIVPVVLGAPEAAMNAGAALLERGVFVSAIRPPTVPAGTSRLRISLGAAHTDEHVEKLIAALNQALG